MCVRLVFCGIFNTSISADFLFTNLDVAVKFKTLVREHWRELVDISYFDHILSKGNTNLKNTLKRVDIYLYLDVDIYDMDYVESLEKAVRNISNIK